MDKICQHLLRLQIYKLFDPKQFIFWEFTCSRCNCRWDFQRKAEKRAQKVLFPKAMTKQDNIAKHNLFKTPETNQRHITSAELFIQLKKPTESLLKKKNSVAFCKSHIR